MPLSFKELKRIKSSHYSSYLNTTYSSSFLPQAINRYRVYFNIPLQSRYFVSKLNNSFSPKDDLYRVAEQSRLIKGSRLSPEMNVMQVQPCQLPDSVIYRHLLSATHEIHPDLHCWLHQWTELESDLLVIDRDYKDTAGDANAFYSRTPEDLALISHVFGDPDLIVSSRHPFAGFHAFYKLDKKYQVDVINSYGKVMFEQAGVIVKQGEWEVFPKSKNMAYTALPFGMNSQIITNGKLNQKKGVLGLLHWAENIYDHHKRLTLDQTILKELTKYRPPAIVDPNENKHISLAGASLSAISESIAELGKEPAKFKRREAQLLLKYKYQVLEGLSVDDSIENALQWFQDNPISKDFKNNPVGAEKDLRELYTNKPLSPMLSKALQLPSKLIDKLLSELMMKHTDMIKALPFTGRQFHESVFSVYAQYIYIYAECYRKGTIGRFTAIRTRFMRKWPGGSNKSYALAVKVLKSVKLIEQKPSLYYSKKVEDNLVSRQECGQYLVKSLKYQKSEAIGLNKAKLKEIILTRLPEYIGRDIFGEHGYQLGVQKIKDQT